MTQSGLLLPAHLHSWDTIDRVAYQALAQERLDLGLVVDVHIDAGVHWAAQQSRRGGLAAVPEERR